jgi:starch synthase
MTGLIPAYIKHAYKKEPVFSNAKIVYTIGQNTFEEKFNKDLLTKAIINTNIKDKDLEPFKDLNNAALFRGGATYADAISFGSDIIDKKLVSEFSAVKGKKVVPFNGWDSDLTEYLDLYNELASK